MTALSQWDAVAQRRAEVRAQPDHGAEDQPPFPGRGRKAPPSEGLKNLPRGPRRRPAPPGSTAGGYFPCKDPVAAAAAMSEPRPLTCVRPLAEWAARSQPMQHTATWNLPPPARLSELLASFGCADVIAPIDAAAFGRRAGELIRQGARSQSSVRRDGHPQRIAGCAPERATVRPTYNGRRSGGLNITPGCGWGSSLGVSGT